MSEIIIESVRVSPLYDLKKNQPAGFFLEFRQHGKRLYKGFSLDNFDKKEDAEIALKQHNDGTRVYKPAYTKGEKFICKAVESKSQ